MTAAPAFQLIAPPAAFPANDLDDDHGPISRRGREVKAQHLVPNDTIRYGARLFRVDYVAVSIPPYPVEVRCLPLLEDGQLHPRLDQVTLEFVLDEIVRRIV
jgi:hypothetical protein